MGAARIVFVSLALSWVPVTAGASTDWRMGAEAQTDLPLQAGGRLWFEAPYGIHLDTSLGTLPPGYVDLINSVVVGVGGYDQETATVISSVVSSSLVWRLHLGWRPSAEYGVYFAAGYGLVTISGEVGSGKLILAATGIKVPDGTPDVGQPFRASSTLHMIDAEIGYMWSMIEDHLTIRLALGFAGTLGSSTTVEPLFQPSQPAVVKDWTARSEVFLDDIYTTYLFMPVISVGMGYRFF
jgi:hypothetical protein